MMRWGQDQSVVKLELGVVLQGGGELRLQGCAWVSGWTTLGLGVLGREWR